MSLPLRRRLACRLYHLSERRHGPADYRRRREQQAPPSTDVASGMRIRQHHAGDVPVRLHLPSEGDTTPGVHVLFHAGAFCYGAPHDLDALAHRYATDAGCAVAAVGYRLAPEHAWPAAIEDGYAVLRWLVAEGPRLGIDPSRMSVGGVSAGGCVAAAVALLARDRGGPALCFQLLEVPILDVAMSTGDTMRRYGRGRVLTAAHLAESYAMYVPDPADRTHPYASPVLAPDLAGLPPAAVLTADEDPLRDEGELYARRLREAGVETHALRAEGHVHSSLFGGEADAEPYRAAVVALLAAAHRRSGPR